MLGFLTPLALLGLGLLAIPILVHIFKPRKVRQTPFSSLRFLRASQHRLSRRVQWHQLLLFLLRAGLIAALVLALAKPILAERGAGAGQAERFVVLNLGRTMGYQLPDGQTPLDLARVVAEQVVSQVVAGDRTTIILAAEEPLALGPLVSDASIYLTRMRAAPLAASRTQLTAALRLVGPLLGTPRADSHIELIFITDNASPQWSQAAISRFLTDAPLPVKVQVIEVAPTQPTNAWLTTAELRETRQPPRRWLQAQVGSAGHEAERRTVRLSGLAGLPPQEKQLQLRPGALVPVSFDLPADYELAGQVARLALDPADNLPSDDVTWVNLDATGSTRVLLLEGPTTAIAELQPSYHLRQALEVLSGPDFGGLSITRRPADGALGEALAAADLIVLVEVAGLAATSVRALEDAVSQGAGLLIYPGPEAQREVYNTLLHDPLRPSASLLPVTLGELVNQTHPEGVWPRLAALDWEHPLLARLRDPLYGDFDQARYAAWYRLVPAAGGRALTVLARHADGTPAMLEHRLGAGRVLLCNTSANDRWTDLPRRPCYLPWLDQLLRYLTGGPRHGTFAVGELVLMPLPESAAELQVSVTAPSGETLTPGLRRVGPRSFMQLEATRLPGLYQVNYEAAGGGAPRGSFPFVVLPDTTDSAIPPSHPETLAAWWTPAQFELLRPEKESGQLALARTRWDLTPWLVGLACLCLLAEMFFVHWFCPRVNPVVTTGSRLAREGFLQSSGNPPPSAGGSAR